MARSDLFSGVVFLVLGIATFVISWQMPRFEENGANLYEAPGIVPGLLGLIIAVLGLLLAVRATRSLAHRSQVSASTSTSTSTSTGPLFTRTPIRIGFTLLLTLGYGGIMLGNLPFWLATGIFVWVFIFGFEWGFARSRSEKVVILFSATVISVVVSAAVTCVFQNLFLVTLP